MNPKSTVVIKERALPSQTFRACIDTVRAESSLQLDSWLGGLLVWFGPTFGQGQSQPNSTDGYKKHRTGHGIGLHIRLRSIHGNRSWAVDISFINWTALSGRMSIQWNLSIHSIVPENSDIFYYAKTSNLQAVQSILASRKGSPSDTTPNGLSLLHVRIIVFLTSYACTDKGRSHQKQIILILSICSLRPALTQMREIAMDGMELIWHENRSMTNIVTQYPTSYGTNWNHKFRNHPNSHHAWRRPWKSGCRREDSLPYLFQLDSRKSPFAI